MALLVLVWADAALCMSVKEITDVARCCVALVSVRNAQGQQNGSGSGFVISSSGRLVTNYHVIDGATQIVAVFPEGREARVTGVWAHDQQLDLAVLQLERGSYQPLPLAAEAPRESEEIVLIGYPHGLGPAVTTGIVSALQREGIGEELAGEDLPGWALRITATSEPGSSGSPILRGSGEVVGVLVGDLAAFKGIRFGIPVSKLQALQAKSFAEPQALTDVTGGRSVQKNLLISGACLMGVALFWVAGWYLHGRLQARRASAKR
jgi:S1-C subfamily serine protease